MYREIEGDLITLALGGSFDVIAHGCNCFCTMSAGIAPQMAKTFGCNNFFLENNDFKGDILKLGTIDYEKRELKNPSVISTVPFEKGRTIYVVNAYTQFNYGSNHLDGVSTPLDYEALTLCMRKMNRVFKDRHIGLPLIGCGLAGGDWNIVKSIIQKELVNCDVTVVFYKK